MENTKNNLVDEIKYLAQIEDIDEITIDSENNNLLNNKFDKVILGLTEILGNNLTHQEALTFRDIFNRVLSQSKDKHLISYFQGDYYDIELYLGEKQGVKLDAELYKDELSISLLLESNDLMNDNQFLSRTGYYMDKSAMGTYFSTYHGDEYIKFDRNQPTVKLSIEDLGNTYELTLPLVPQEILFERMCECILKNTNIES